MGKKIKRKRGGQPGNRNACKHGFYSSNMSLQELGEFYKMINTGGYDREKALLRIKLNSALYSVNRSPRVLADASRLLAKWLRSQLHWAAKDNAELKKYVRRLLDEAMVQFNETIRG
jgi:hypothetical protein